MDRTTEFRAAVNSLTSRGHIPSRQHQPPPYYSNVRKSKEAAAFAEFSQLAYDIGQEARETLVKLHKLTKLVKRKTLFDDRPVEISELTFIIKQDLAKLSSQIVSLQHHVRATAAKGSRATRQMDEHSANVVGILQNKLKSASLGFKEALDIRTESIQASKKRQEQLLQSGQTQALPNLQTQSPFQPPGPVRGQSPGNGPGHQVSLSVPHSSVLSPLRNNTRSPIGLVPVSPTPSTLPTGQSIPQGRSSSPLMQTNSPSLQHHSRRPSTPSSVSSQPYHQSQYSNGAYAETETNYSSSSMHRRKVGGHQYEDDNEAAGPASMLYQQQQYAPQVDQHQQNRSTAIEAIESTMQELGGIFQQLAQMVAEQRDTVQRIEANVDDIEVNINEAQNQLLRYYRNISSDRWLMIKLFLTIIFVFLVVSLVS